MKNAKEFCAALVLTLTLSGSIFAGQISTPRTDPQPEVPAPSTTQGEMDTPQVAGEISTGIAVDPVVEGTLSLLQIVLTLV